MKTSRIRAELCSDADGYTRLVDPGALPKRFCALAYTWRQFRLYTTKKAAMRGLMAWKRAHESLGFTITGSQSTGYRAWEGSRSVAAATIHTYIEGKRS